MNQLNMSPPQDSDLPSASRERHREIHAHHVVGIQKIEQLQQRLRPTSSVYLDIHLIWMHSSPNINTLFSGKKQDTDTENMLKC